MDKYVSAAEIRADVEWLQSQGVRDLDLREVLERIELLIPAANVAEVRHGKWIDPEDDDSATTWYCSKCSYPVRTMGGYPSYSYCPNCGALMKEEEHES